MLVKLNYAINIMQGLRDLLTSSTLSSLTNRIKLWVGEQADWAANVQKTYSDPRLSLGFRVQCQEIEGEEGTFVVRQMTRKPSNVEIDWDGQVVQELETFLSTQEFEAMQERANNWIRIEALDGWQINTSKNWVDESESDDQKRAMITAVFHGDVNGQLVVEVNWGGHDVTD